MANWVQCSDRNISWHCCNAGYTQVVWCFLILSQVFLVFFPMDTIRWLRHAGQWAAQDRDRGEMSWRCLHHVLPVESLASLGCCICAPCTIRSLSRSLSQQDSTRQTNQQNNASISTRFDSAPDSSFNQAMRCEEMYRSNSETLWQSASQFEQTACCHGNYEKCRDAVRECFAPLALGRYQLSIVHVGKWNWSFCHVHAQTFFQNWFEQILTCMIVFSIITYLSSRYMVMHVTQSNFWTRMFPDVLWASGVQCHRPWWFGRHRRRCNSAQIRAGKDHQRETIIGRITLTTWGMRDKLKIHAGARLQFQPL